MILILRGERPRRAGCVPVLSRFKVCPAPRSNACCIENQYPVCQTNSFYQPTSHTSIHKDTCSHILVIRNKVPLRFEWYSREEIFKQISVIHGWVPYEHYSDVIMSAMTSQITSVSIVCSSVCSGTDQRKHQSSASLAFVRGIRRWLVNSPHKGPVTRKMFPFGDVIMICEIAIPLDLTDDTSTLVQVMA